MKKLLISLFVFSLIYAHEDFRGYVEYYGRYWINPDYERWTWNETRFNLEKEGSPFDNIHYYAEMRFRLFGFSDIGNLSDLQRKDKEGIYPWSLELKEAYVDIYGFLLPVLDLRIGRQVISWGTADKINPTSNLSPYDFEDIFEFGEKFGINALRGVFNFDNIIWEIDFIPYFKPAILPSEEWGNVFYSSELPSLPGMQIIDLKDSVIMPERKISDCSEFATKISGNFMNWDFSLSYFYGYDGLPLPEKIDFAILDTFGNARMNILLSYPRIQVIGFDFAGSLKSIGLWGEGALFIPEDFVLKTTIPSYPPIVMEDTLLKEKEPYFKFVLGGDYTFKNGLYVNFQYIHGFLHERGKDSLNDYFVLRVEKKFLNERLKISPLTLVYSVSDWDNVSENYGIGWIPEIEYKPGDNIEVSTGVIFIDGKGNNFLAMLKEHDEVFLKIKLSF